MEQGGEVTEPQPQNKMQALRDQTNGVLDTMKRNIEQLLNREVKLVDLIDKSKKMEEGAYQFKHTSQEVARSYRWKNVKIIVVIVVVVLIIVLIIILLATGVIPISAPVPPVVNPTSKPTKP